MPFQAHFHLQFEARTLDHNGIRTRVRANSVVALLREIKVNTVAWQFA